MLSKNEKGQSLLEVVIALAVIVIIVGALTFSTISSIRNSQAAKDEAQATKLAQEGLEWVRTGRDRNQCITINTKDINSWDGNNSNCSGSGSIWQSISQVYSCESTGANTASSCYFTITSDGMLHNGALASSFPTALAEGIPSLKPIFHRAIIISDDINGDGNFSDPTVATAKKVTAIVTWVDFSGTHQSRLTTILRKLQ